MQTDCVRDTFKESCRCGHHSWKTKRHFGSCNASVSMNITCFCLWNIIYADFMFIWLFIPAKRMLYPDFICCFQSPTHFFLLSSSVPPPLQISPSLFHFLPVSGSVPFPSFSQSWFSYFHTSPLFPRHPSLPTFTLLSPLNIDLLHSLVLLNLSRALLSPCKVKTMKQTACKTSCPLSIRENINRSIENSPHSQWNVSCCPPLIQFNPTCKTEKSGPWLGCANITDPDIICVCGLQWKSLGAEAAVYTLLYKNLLMSTKSVPKHFKRKTATAVPT